MKTFRMLALLATVLACGSAQAAIRTFTIDAGTNGSPPPTITQVGVNFELSPSALNDNLANGPSEVLLSNQISHSSILSGPLTLKNVTHGFTSGSAYTFVFTDAFANQVQVALNSAPFNLPTGAPLPDGTDATAQVRVKPSMGVWTSHFATVTIGTVAVPEPSAFAFGGLALVVTGVGRFVRRRFFAAA